MAAVGPSLKKLRQSTVPQLSIRQTAEKLGVGHSSYAFYENPNTYKKSYLPIEFARRVATLFAEYGVDAAEVMKLAGLTSEEAEPEAREIEAAKPPIQFVSLPVALPSEAALRDMFRSLLDLVPHLLPEDATKDEIAEMLAQRLPSGFAAIGPVVLDPRSVSTPAAGATPPAPARDRHEPAPKLRT